MVCVCLCMCVRVCVWFVFPALPGSRGAACAGRWIVLLGCGVAVSRFVWRMDVGDRGQAYHRVTSQTTECHAPQSMTCPPPRGLKKNLFFFNISRLRFNRLILTPEFILVKEELTACVMLRFIRDLQMIQFINFSVCLALS